MLNTWFSFPTELQRDGGDTNISPGKDSENLVVDGYRSLRIDLLELRLALRSGKKEFLSWKVRDLDQSAAIVC